MSIENHMESFNIEQPPNYYQKRGSGYSDASDISEEISNDNIIFQKDNSSSETPEPGENKGCYCLRGDTEISCILNIIVSAIGGGCFSFPYIIYEGGIIVSFICFMLVTFSIYYSIDLLRSFVVDTKYYSFSLMTETILGSLWLKIYAFSSFIIYTSMEVSYLSSIYIYIHSMYRDEFDNILSNILYFLISIIFEIIIFLYITKIANIHLLSTIIIICFTIMLISLIIVSIIANWTGQVGAKFNTENWYFPNLSHNTVVNKILKISSYLMVYTYAYSYHSTFPTLIGSLYNVNNRTTKRVHLVSFGAIFISYFLISIFGFILSDEVPSELFQENDELFNGGWATFRKPFKYIIIFFLLFLLPIRFIVLRDNYIILIGKKKVTFLKELTIVVIFIIICNILVFCIVKFESDVKDLQIKSLFQAFGGIFGVIISFCLPVVNYVSVNGKYKIKSIIGYLIIGIFVLAGILATGHTFYQIFTGKSGLD